MSKIFWNQVYSLTEQLTANVNTDHDQIQTIISQLESICIAHERSFEPADEFEEYVTLSLCRAIADTLKKQSAS